MESDKRAPENLTLELEEFPEIVSGSVLGLEEKLRELWSSPLSSKRKKLYLTKALHVICHLGHPGMLLALFSRLVTWRKGLLCARYKGLLPFQRALFEGFDFCPRTLARISGPRPPYVLSSHLDVLDILLSCGAEAIAPIHVPRRETDFSFSDYIRMPAEEEAPAEDMFLAPGDTFTLVSLHASPKMERKILEIISEVPYRGNDREIAHFVSKGGSLAMLERAVNSFQYGSEQSNLYFLPKLAEFGTVAGMKLGLALCREEEPSIPPHDFYSFLIAVAAFHSNTDVLSYLLSLMEEPMEIRPPAVEFDNPKVLETILDAGWALEESEDAYQVYEEKGQKNILDFLHKRGYSAYYSPDLEREVGWNYLASEHPCLLSWEDELEQLERELEPMRRILPLETPVY